MVMDLQIIRVITYNTDPNNLDSDDDGIYDGDEVSLGVMEISFIHNTFIKYVINDKFNVNYDAISYSDIQYSMS